LRVNQRFFHDEKMGPRLATGLNGHRKGQKERERTNEGAWKQKNNETNWLAIKDRTRN